MNYSTLKKSFAVSLVGLAGVTSVANAQTDTTEVTTVVTDTVTTATTTTTMSQDMPMTSSAKMFGGRPQFRTWSIGVHAGVLSPFVAIGGTNDFNKPKMQLGYGINIRKQFAPSFSLELSGVRGKIAGENNADAGSGHFTTNKKSFETELQYAVDLKGVVNVGTVDFLRRENSMNFFVTAGYGYAAYSYNVDGNTGKGKYGKDHDKDYIHETYIPVGAGVKFKVSDRVNFNLGYTMNFLDADNLDGVWANGASNKDKFSYGYAGLEFGLGSSSKPSLEWANPLAMMYDELKDPSLRQEVEALKGRVSNVEAAVENLKRDSDGDGVSDQFDKCPGTPAGTAVDGSGCPLPAATATVVNGVTSNTIQFDFDSSVLRTDAYPSLDKISSDLRANSGRATLNGYASSEGTAAYNMKLSRDRANSVKTYLVNSGVSSSSLSVKAYGEANPVASNATEAGRSQNRRVEVSM